MTMLSLLALYSPKLISWLLKCVLVVNSIDGRQLTIHDAVVQDSSTRSPVYSKLRQKKSVVGRWWPYSDYVGEEHLYRPVADPVTAEAHGYIERPDYRQV